MLGLRLNPFSKRGPSNLLCFALVRISMPMSPTSLSYYINHWPSSLTYICVTVVISCALLKLYGKQGLTLIFSIPLDKLGQSYATISLLFEILLDKKMRFIFRLSKCKINLNLTTCQVRYPSQRIRFSDSKRSLSSDTMLLLNPGKMLMVISGQEM